MSDLNRQVAERINYKRAGKFRSFEPDTDANQIDAAVREWCSFDDGHRWLFFCQALFATMMNDDYPSSTDGLIDGMEMGVRATPEQKCRALIAAAEDYR